ncbi:MAG: DUF1730 domain-containing protein [Muribaculaceae bacterium]|nr:DUF1730 domain-containing protein [Muribaculaceae bacterium]
MPAEEALFNILLAEDSGACAAGIAPLTPVAADIMEAYTNWLGAGNQAEMHYLENHLPIREDPVLLLDGAKSIISLAFPYPAASQRLRTLPAIATYAQGDDYHDVLRTRLSGVTERLKALFGGDYRICIDSAPIFERYWAEICRIGTRADNGLITIPGYGTRIFLAEILTTLPISTFIPDPPSPVARHIPNLTLKKEKEGSGIPCECTHCGACRRVCPAGALRADSTVNARRCLSYLTIEHKGEWTSEGLEAMSTPAGKRTLFGCDLCQSCCPLNSHAQKENPAATTQSATLPLYHSAPAKAGEIYGITPAGAGEISERRHPLPEFSPRPRILTLTAEDILALTQPEFSLIFKGSPIKRAKLAGLQRNALNTLPNDPDS